MKSRQRRVQGPEGPVPRKQGATTNTGTKAAQRCSRADNAATPFARRLFGSAVTGFQPRNSGNAGEDGTGGPPAAPGGARERLSWRTTAVSVGSVGSPICIGMLHPLLGELVAAIEVMVILGTIATALFGSEILSERAFRLLRWISNRPEPPSPPARQV